jgi:hypothetical protein
MPGHPTPSKLSWINLGLVAQKAGGATLDGYGVRVTLAVAIVGVVLAATSLGWQFWTYLNNGPRVIVKSSAAITAGVPGSGFYACVSAINRGRAATTVSAWGFSLPSGASIVQTRALPWSTQVPHRLEPQSAADFHMDASELFTTCQERGIDPASLRSWVRLASGKQIMGGAPGVQA